MVFICLCLVLGKPSVVKTCDLSEFSAFEMPWYTKMLCAACTKASFAFVDSPNKQLAKRWVT